MKFSKHLKYSRGISNTEWEGLTKPAVTIILNQYLYWWSSDRATQHSHLTVSTRAFYPHHATRAFGSIRSDTGKNWGVGGEWGVSLKPGPKQITPSTWLSTEQTWHTHGNEHEDQRKLWKNGELYPWTFRLLPCGLHSSFMPALMLIRSFTKLIKLINSAVRSSHLGDWAELAQWWVQCAELAQRRWWKHDCGSRKKRAGTLLSAAATF